MAALPFDIYSEVVSYLDNEDIFTFLRNNIGRIDPNLELAYLEEFYRRAPKQSQIYSEVCTRYYPAGLNRLFATVTSDVKGCLIGAIQADNLPLFFTLLGRWEINQDDLIIPYFFILAIIYESWNFFQLFLPQVSQRPNDLDQYFLVAIGSSSLRIADFLFNEFVIHNHGTFEDNKTLPQMVLKAAVDSKNLQTLDHVLQLFSDIPPQISSADEERFEFGYYVLQNQIFNLVTNDNVQFFTALVEKFYPDELQNYISKVNIENSLVVGPEFYRQYHHLFNQAIEFLPGVIKYCSFEEIKEAVDETPFLQDIDDAEMYDIFNAAVRRNLDIFHFLEEKFHFNYREMFNQAEFLEDFSNIFSYIAENKNLDCMKNMYESLPYNEETKKSFAEECVKYGYLDGIKYFAQEAYQFDSFDYYIEEFSYLDIPNKDYPFDVVKYFWEKDKLFDASKILDVAAKNGANEAVIQFLLQIGADNISAAATGAIQRGNIRIFKILLESYTGNLSERERYEFASIILSVSNFRMDFSPTTSESDDDYEIYFGRKKVLKNISHSQLVNKTITINGRLVEQFLQILLEKTPQVFQDKHLQKAMRDYFCISGNIFLLRRYIKLVSVEKIYDLAMMSITSPKYVKRENIIIFLFKEGYFNYEQTLHIMTSCTKEFISLWKKLILMKISPHEYGRMKKLYHSHYKNDQTTRLSEDGEYLLNNRILYGCRYYLTTAIDLVHRQDLIDFFDQDIVVLAENGNPSEFLNPSFTSERIIRKLPCCLSSSKNYLI